MALNILTVRLVLLQDKIRNIVINACSLSVGWLLMAVVLVALVALLMKLQAVAIEKAPIQ